MGSFDSMADKEFHIVFNRISRRVNLKDCATPEEVNACIKGKINHYRITYGSTPLGALKIEGKISSLRNLICEGFARRTINDAIAYPQGKVALTLRHGREKARSILTKRKNKRLWL